MTRPRSAALVNDECGASTVEYGLLIVSVAAVVVALVFVLGGFTAGTFSDTCDEVNRAAATLSTSRTC